jgi:hypothetical protein
MAETKKTNNSTSRESPSQLIAPRARASELIRSPATTAPMLWGRGFLREHRRAPRGTHPFNY